MYFILPPNNTSTSCCTTNKQVHHMQLSKIGCLQNAKGFFSFPRALNVAILIAILILIFNCVVKRVKLPLATAQLKYFYCLSFFLY